MFFSAFDLGFFLRSGNGQSCCLVLQRWWKRSERALLCWLHREELANGRIMFPIGSFFRLWLAWLTCQRRRHTVDAAGGVSAWRQALRTLSLNRNHVQLCALVSIAEHFLLFFAAGIVSQFLECAPENVFQHRNSSEQHDGCVCTSCQRN